MDFTRITNITIPEGNAADLKCNDELLWSAGPSSVNYLCFTAIEDNSSIAMEKVGSGTMTEPLLEYSYDKEEWNTYSMNVVLALDSNDKIYFRGENSTFGVSSSTFYNFKMTGKIAASGNIMTILNGDEPTKVIETSYAFCRLFKDCSSLVSTPLLPATTLSQNCYYEMFRDCDNLTNSPNLPATTLTNYCYGYMFEGCSSLINTPATLPATTLA